MHRHDLHGAAAVGARLALAAASLAQPAHVLQKRAGADQTAALCVEEQLADVARTAGIVRSQQDRPVAGAVDKVLEQVGHGHAPRQLMEFLDQSRSRAAGRVFIGAERRPERARCGPIAQAQTVQRRVGQAESGRTQQAVERQVVGRVGQGLQRVEQVAHLWAFEKATTGHGFVGDAGALAGVFVGGEAAGGAAEDGDVAPTRRRTIGGGQAAQPLRQAVRGAVQAAVALRPGSQMKLDVGRRQQGCVGRARCGQGRERLAPRCVGCVAAVHRRGQ